MSKARDVKALLTAMSMLPIHAGVRSVFVRRRMCVARSEGVAHTPRTIACGAQLAGGGAAVLEGGVARGVRGVEPVRIAERGDFAVE